MHFCEVNDVDVDGWKFLNSDWKNHWRITETWRMGLISGILIFGGKLFWLGEWVNEEIERRVKHIYVYRNFSRI